MMRRWMLALVATSVGVSACSDVRLEFPDTAVDPTIVDNELSVSGQFCTSPAGNVSYPLKVMFIVDGSGSQQFEWSGTDQSGNKLADGQYTVSVEATNASGNPVTASTTVEGVVTGISYENGYAELLIGNRRVLPGDVISVSESTPAPSSNPGASINRP